MFTPIMMKADRGLKPKTMFDFLIIVLTPDTFMPVVVHRGLHTSEGKSKSSGHVMSEIRGDQ